MFFEATDTGTLYILTIDPITHVHSWQVVGENLDVKASVRAATTTALPLYIATADTLTEDGLGVLPAIDGVTLVVGDRVLVKDEAGPLAPNNGIYVVTDVGSVTTPWILTRPPDAMQGTLTSGAFVFVTEGTVNAGTGWILTTPDPIIVGTTPLTWTQFSGAGTFVAGPGIDITGNVISIENPNQASIVWDKDQTIGDGTGNTGLTIDGYLFFDNTVYTDDFGNPVGPILAEEGPDSATPGTGHYMTGGTGWASDGTAAGTAGGAETVEGGRGGAGTATQAAGNGGMALLKGGIAGAANGGPGGSGGSASVNAGLGTNGTKGAVNIGNDGETGTISIGLGGGTPTVTTLQGNQDYTGGTEVTDVAEGISFTASKNVSRYRITATGITVTLASTDPDGTTYEIWNVTKSATPNITFTPNGGLTINIAGSYTQASININTDYIARSITKMNGEWWIAS